jgi:hypothetical protein
MRMQYHQQLFNFEMFFELMTIVFLGFAGVVIPILRCMNRKLILPDGKKVGPTYWGRYSDTAHNEDPRLVCFEVKRPSDVEAGLAGSLIYSQGKPVKSLRK